jgi:hypothetical protein
MEALTSMLEENEQLYNSFYGTLTTVGFYRTVADYKYGFFGRTDSHILIAILNILDGKEVEWATKIPMDIKKVKICKSILPKYHTIKIYFNDHKPIAIKMWEKLLIGDFVNQQKNVTEFLNYFKQYTK